MNESPLNRCEWVGTDPLYVAYHDQEWGVPVYDDQKLFEMLCLEGAQAGLSWSTILRKRENYRKAFANFDPVVIATFDSKFVEQLLLDPGIVRNRRKITSVVTNAKSFLKIQQEFGSFCVYAWNFVNRKPIQNSWHQLSEIPASTEVSMIFSKDLRQRGFNFVGPTIIYAFMQAVGMVNDHITDCFRYPLLKQ